jgi:hypothetical protein
MNKNLPPVESNVASYMTRLHVLLVPVLMGVVQQVARRVERSELPPAQMRAAFGAACMSAFLEAAQKISERCGMSQETFAQGLRIHADELEGERSPSFVENYQEAGLTRH